MKKFLSKKPVWIAFLVAAVIFLAVEIGILVRPVSYGLNYTDKSGSSIVKVNVKSDKILRQTMIDDDKDQKIVVDFWIYRDGHDVYMLGTKEFVRSEGLSEIEEAMYSSEFDSMKITKNEYKDIVEVIKDAKDKGDTEYKIALGTLTKGHFEFGIFEIEDSEFKCPQAIAFVVVHGVFTVALITFAVLSTIVVLKKKK